MSDRAAAKSILFGVLLAAWSPVDSYEGVMKTKAGSVETTTDVKARRLGACPK